MHGPRTDVDRTIDSIYLRNGIGNISCDSILPYRNGYVGSVLRLLLLAAKKTTSQTADFEWFRRSMMEHGDVECDSVSFV